MCTRLAILWIYAKFLLQSLCYINAAAYHHNIYVVGGSFQKYIAYVSTYKITLYMHLVGHFAYLMKNLLVEYLCQLGITI